MIRVALIATLCLAAGCAASDNRQRAEDRLRAVSPVKNR